MENTLYTHKLFSHKIGKNCDIASDVIIGNNPKIGNNVRICSGTIIGDNVNIYDGAIIGSDPQDLVYKNDLPTQTIIGDNVTIREYVTINRGSERTLKTMVGDNCYLMTYSHVSHDTILGNNVILANSVQIGGNSFIGDFVFMGGGAVLHQKGRIGKHAMIGGGSVLNKDVLPFSTILGVNTSLIGINIVGIKKNYGKEKVSNIQEIFSKLKEKGLFNSKIKYIESLSNEESQII